MSDDSKKPVTDNRSRQLNDHDPLFHRTRGASAEEAERRAAEAQQRDGVKPHDGQKK